MESIVSPTLCGKYKTFDDEDLCPIQTSPMKVLFSKRPFHTGQELCVPTTTWTGINIVHSYRQDKARTKIFVVCDYYGHPGQDGHSLLHGTADMRRRIGGRGVANPDDGQKGRRQFENHQRQGASCFPSHFPYRSLHLARSCDCRIEEHCAGGCVDSLRPAIGKIQAEAGQGNADLS